MKSFRSPLAILLCIGLVVAGCFSVSVETDSVVTAPYPDEKAATVGRAFVCLPQANGQVALMWRRLATDEPDSFFEVFRVNRSTGINERLGATEKTFFVDTYPEKKAGDGYRLVVNQKLQKPLNVEAEVTPNAISLGPGMGALFFDVGEAYQQARVATADLNGDGDLDLVIQFSGDRNLDPYEVYKKLRKSGDTVKVAAFLRSGELLWTIDLGWGIEAGAVYSPMVLWDLDADGRAEVILKTNPSGDPLNYAKERITILDGMSGRILREARWPSTEGIAFGPTGTGRGTQDVYNNMSRNYLAIAHLDGRTPTIIAARGLYLAQRIVGFDTELNQKWEKLNGLNTYNPLRHLWKSDHIIQRSRAKLDRDEYRGSHSLPVVDINADGKEEILWGEVCIGAGGKAMWKIKERFPYNGHADIVAMADITPNNDGNEVFYCREGWGKTDDNIGMGVFNQRGEVVWGRWGYTHIDGGWVARVVPGSTGLQCFGFDLQRKNWEQSNVQYTDVAGYLWDHEGRLIKEVDDAWVRSFPLDWNGDGVKEICLENGAIIRYTDEPIIEASGFPLWGADLYGDHREELVITQPGSKVLILFNTDPPEGQSRYAPIEDRRYRNDLSRTAMQFNVVPTESGYIYTVEAKKQ